MRRLAPDELRDVAAELGAEATVYVDELAMVQAGEAEVIGAMASLLVAIIRDRPFDRRNAAVGIASVDLLARLNRRSLSLDQLDDVLTLVADIRSGMQASEVRSWLHGRAVVRAPVAGPRCPTCSMPLREALNAHITGSLIVASCAGCGSLLGRPFPHRPLQEV